MTTPHLSHSLEPYASLVSVVVTSYAMERLKDLLELLDSLKAQTYRNLEIVFVGEGTRELCSRVQGYAEEQRLHNLRIVFNDGLPGLSPARNLGVQHSKGDIISFIDDDALAFPEWAEEIVKTFETYKQAIGIAGPSLPLWEDSSMKWFPEELFWLISCSTPKEASDQGVRQVRNVWGVNMAFRREAFALCRFSEDFIGGNQGSAEGLKLGLEGEDTEFCIQLSRETGRPILFNPRVRLFHKAPYKRLSSPFIRRQAFWQGYTRAVLRQRFGRSFSLSKENAVVGRILFRLLPSALGQLIFRPSVGWRRLSVALTVLFHAFLGYCAGRFPRLGHHLARPYSR